MWELIPLDWIQPSPENDALYKPAAVSDLEIQGLAVSIRAFGVLEPLVLTRDHYIVSGHRRYAASQLAGLQYIPCRVEKFYRESPEFVTLLREHNRQRVKSHDEIFREHLVSANPEEAYQALLEHREQVSRVDMPAFELEGEKKRSAISSAKTPFLEAVYKIIKEMERFWPLSLRQIHYGLLNVPPLVHAGKPDSVYKNRRQDYQNLSVLLTRARLNGLIPMNIIQDETRPVTKWDVHANLSPFMEREIKNFLKGYRRNLQQSQPCHIEVCLEKNTVKGVLEQVAGRYSIPVTTMRGYVSVPPRHAIAERFRKSGKDKLILLVFSDFDPDGEEIAHSLARSMRDDFDIENIHPIKVGLSFEQVKALNLPPNMDAKVSSSNHAKFVTKYGTNVFELEAVAPALLQQWRREAIDSVMDTEAFNAELKQEKKDAAYLQTVRTLVSKAMRENVSAQNEQDQEK